MRVGMGFFGRSDKQEAPVEEGSGGVKAGADAAAQTVSSADIKMATSDGAGDFVRPSREKVRPRSQQAVESRAARHLTRLPLSCHAQAVAAGEAVRPRDASGKPYSLLLPSGEGAVGGRCQLVCSPWCPLLPANPAAAKMGEVFGVGVRLYFNTLLW